MTIDIMMPFYGDPSQFRMAVGSVLAQTEKDWRLVVIDDRFPDPEPGRWVQALGDPRVEYRLNEANLGVSGNFQRCVELARAEYVVIMGCDDVMLPRYVERLNFLIDQFPASSYIQPGVEVIDTASRVGLALPDRIKRWFRPRGPYPRVLSGESLAAGLLDGNWTYFPSLCWRTDEIQRHGFRAEYRIVLDLALQLALIEDGGTLVLDDDVVFQYRRHESVSSWSGSGSRRFTEEKTLFREAYSSAQRLGWPRARRAAALHLTSRLNAVANLPAALRSRDGLAEVLRHLTSR